MKIFNEFRYQVLVYHKRSYISIKKYPIDWRIGYSDQLLSEHMFKWMYAEDFSKDNLFTDAQTKVTLTPSNYVWFS